MSQYAQGAQKSLTATTTTKKNKKQTNMMSGTRSILHIFFELTDWTARASMRVLAHSHSCFLRYYRFNSVFTPTPLYLDTVIAK